MIKAIIFDCFGVVVSDGFTDLINELKLSETQIKKVGSLIDQVNKGAMKPYSYRLSASQVVGLTPEEYKKKMNTNIKNDKLLNYILELRNDYKIAILSNVGSKESLESRFEKDELNKYFDAVIASAEIGYAKPEAQAYEIAATDLGVLLEECIMIDDREQYCEGAIGVGMKAILYKTFNDMKSELNNLLASQLA